jgi:hypothetical protein
MAIIVAERYQNINANCQGEIVENPVYEMINTDTNITETFTLNKNFEIKPGVKLSSLFMENLFTELTNSQFKSMYITKKVTLENYPARRELEFENETFQIVYDWETTTGEQSTQFKLVTDLKIAFVTIIHRNLLNQNFYFPSVQLVTSGYDQYKIFNVYLNNKQTFTTTAVQKFNMVMCFADGWQCGIEIPVVRTV